MYDEYVRRAALDILRNPHRRFVLSHLNGQEAPLTTRRLAQAIVDWESTSGEATPTGQTVEEVMVRLHHEHLPRLADSGVLTYDWERREISDWRHPNLGEEWLSSFPVERLYEVVR
jgi:hypothetical protein